MPIPFEFRSTSAPIAFVNDKFEISWNWVKAHSTDELNNEVDLLARDAANL